MHLDQLTEGDGNGLVDLLVVCLQVISWIVLFKSRQFSFCTCSSLCWSCYHYNDLLFMERNKRATSVDYPLQNCNLASPVSDACITEHSLETTWTSHYSRDEMRWDDGVALPCRSQAKATGVKRKTPHAFISGDEDAAGVNAGLW